MILAIYKIEYSNDIIFVIESETKMYTKISLEYCNQPLGTFDVNIIEGVVGGTGSGIIEPLIYAFEGQNPEVRKYYLNYFSNYCKQQSFGIQPTQYESLEGISPLVIKDIYEYIKCAKKESHAIGIIVGVPQIVSGITTPIIRGKLHIIKPELYITPHNIKFIGYNLAGMTNKFVPLEFINADLVHNAIITVYKRSTFGLSSDILRNTLVNPLQSAMLPEIPPSAAAEPNTILVDSIEKLIARQKELAQGIDIKKSEMIRLEIEVRALNEQIQREEIEMSNLSDSISKLEIDVKGLNNTAGKLAVPSEFDLIGLH
jgi:hypothetical protein